MKSYIGEDLCQEASPGKNLTEIEKIHWRGPVPGRKSWKENEKLHWRGPVPGRKSSKEPNRK
jgi:hypothetical protein